MSFMSNLMKVPSGHLLPARPAADFDVPTHWRAGDHAECIAAFPARLSAPPLGARLRVRRVLTARDPAGSGTMVALVLAGFGDQRFLDCSFRRVTEDTTAQSARQLARAGAAQRKAAARAESRRFHTALLSEAGLPVPAIWGDA